MGKIYDYFVSVGEPLPHEVVEGTDLLSRWLLSTHCENDGLWSH